jgi:hypothetical protein
MSPARILLATATATAALAIAAPGAYATAADDREKGAIPYSSEHHDKVGRPDEQRKGGHTDGGAPMAFDSGMAAGSALLIGGLGAGTGAYVLRRRGM